MKLLRILVQNLGVGVLLLFFMQCTPIDHYYSDYLDNAEKAYPGKVDSILFKPGKQRAAIRSLISTDARVTTMEVSWGRDGYFETEIDPEDIANYKEILIPQIEEGNYTFEIRTLDDEGNQSVRSEIYGRVYGGDYESSLNNRIVDNIKKEGEDLQVNWIPESIDSTLLGTLVSYENAEGISQEVFTGIQDQTVLENFSGNSDFSFQTLFKPSSIAIDTFYAPLQTINIEEYLIAEPKLYPRETWSIADFSSEEPNNNRLADRLLDGDVNSYWITRYSSDPTNYPNHFITIDMDEELDVDGFYFAQKNGDRKIREFELYISLDNETWEDLGLFGLEDINRDYQFIELSQQKSFRFFKIVPTAGHDSKEQPGLAEVGTFYY